MVVPNVQAVMEKYLSGLELYAMMSSQHIFIALNVFLSLKLTKDIFGKKKKKKLQKHFLAHQHKGSLGPTVRNVIGSLYSLFYNLDQLTRITQGTFSIRVECPKLSVE